MCRNKMYLFSSTYQDQQLKFLLLASQTVTSTGQGALFSALLNLLGIMQMNSYFLIFFPDILRNIFLHCVGFFPFVVALHLLLLLGCLCFHYYWWFISETAPLLLCS